MDNRSRILDVALRLFASRGYDAVGVQEIAEASAVTKPTLYHYFGNKLGLFREVCERHEALLLADLRQAADYQGDVPLTLNRIVGASFGFAARHPDYARLRLASWFAPPESEAGQLVAGLVNTQLGLLESLFVQAAQDHGSFRGRSRRYAVALLGVISSYVGHYLQGGLELDSELTFQVVHQYMHGIYS